MRIYAVTTARLCYASLRMAPCHENAELSMMIAMRCWLREQRDAVARVAATALRRFSVTSVSAARHRFRRRQFACHEIEC